ncbi:MULTISPECIES: hypothetical protein [unclassified Pseudomonas]|uniref:hypothetical protein n=1 Tax=unclassified Pseudomonas TaxID=196821 RepID=UPI001A9E077D|nr:MULTISPECIES: hypothetical protein [unclassified Pseudomonas]MCE5993291.1 hypothetical protein [Pseudomonas sp. KCA11]
MLDKDGYDLVCTSAADLGDAQRPRLKSVVIEGLGASVGEMFPGFAAAFPRTVAAIEREYAVPIMLFESYRGTWIASLAAEGRAMNLFFYLVPETLATEGPTFERNCTMLPPRWKELYRYFWSFMLTERSYLSMDWTNSPFSYSGRLSIERYRVLRGVKKAVIRDFVKGIQASSEHYLRCWLLTDAGDALFLDEGKCDGKVYHVKYDDFADYRLLEDPETVLDSYLAHYVSAQSPEGFDFRT